MTHCKRGHERTPENLLERDCRLCRRIRQNERNARLRAEVMRRVEGGEVTHCPAGHRLTDRTVGATGACLACRSVREAPPAKPPRTTCRNGLHPWTPENRTPHGSCRPCANIAAKKRRERIKQDPVVWGRKLERDRIWAHGKRRRLGIPERNWQPGAARDAVLSQGGPSTVAAGPFREWLAGWLRRHPDETEASLAARSGVSDRVLYSWRSGQSRIRVSVLDRVLLAAGEPNALNELYPPKEAAA